MECESPRKRALHYCTGGYFCRSVKENSMSYLKTKFSLTCYCFTLCVRLRRLRIPLVYSLFPIKCRSIIKRLMKLRYRERAPMMAIFLCCSVPSRLSW